MTEPALAPEAVEAVLTMCQLLQRELERFDATAWRMCWVATAVDYEQRTETLAIAHERANSHGRGALLDYSLEIIWAHLRETAPMRDWPNPEPAYLAINCAVAAGIAGDLLGPDLRDHLMAPLEAVKALKAATNL